VFFVVLSVLLCVFRPPDGLNTQRTGGNIRVFCRAGCSRRKHIRVFRRAECAALCV
jgi:hypothetical protein